MKAKFLTTIMLAAVAGLVTSCDMNKYPAGELEDSTAIQSVSDARQFRNTFYIGIRGLSSGGFNTMAELQADCFNGLVINGNRGGEIANGTVLPSNSDITGYWYGLYAQIANTNFFFKHVEPVYEQAVQANNVAAAQSYARFLAEAHFFRGYFYAMMFDRFCPKYTPANGDTPGLGLPIVTEYDPTFDRSKYPGRNTINETIKFIQNEFELAYTGLMEYEEIDDSNLKPMAQYISHYAVAAMQARFALWISDYETAVKKSQEVINSGKYTLAAYADYSAMWTDDESSEIIFMPYEDTQELGGATGSAWLGAQNDQADYIPTSSIIESLMKGYSKFLAKGDVRFGAFVGNRSLTTAYGVISTPCFTKFPGNPALQIGTTNNLVNKPKTFRLSEQYLILAEAAYNKGDENTANDALEALYSARVKGSTYVKQDGGYLLDEIINQRTLELIGEGFRLSDLRRWGKGFKRTANYAGLKNTGANVEEIAQILTPTGLDVVYQPDDHRYTWPIPADEFKVNPQIAGQQNPGY